MNEQDSQGRPLTAACSAHGAAPLLLLACLPLFLMDHLPPGIHTERKVRPYEFMFSFIFFPLETDLRRFNYAKAEKSWVFRLWEQSTVFLFWRFSAVGNPGPACGHTLGQQHLSTESSLSLDLKGPQRHGGLCSLSSFSKRCTVAGPGSRAAMLLPRGWNFVRQPTVRALFGLYLRNPLLTGSLCQVSPKPEQNSSGCALWHLLHIGHPRIISFFLYECHLNFLVGRPLSPP